MVTLSWKGLDVSLGRVRGLPSMGVGILVFLAGFADDWDGMGFRSFVLFGDRKERKKSVGRSCCDV